VESNPHLRFKDGLIRITCCYFGISVAQFMDRYEEDKEVCVPWLTVRGAALSRRQALIFMSEERLKPDFGEDVVAQRTCNAVAEAHARCLEAGVTDPVLLFSDGGFQAEVEVLAKTCDVLVVRLHRTGCTFEGDSRTYIQAAHNIIVEDIWNDGSIGELMGKVLTCVYIA